MKLRPLYEKIALLIESKQELKSKSGLTYVKDMSVSNNTTLVGRVVAVGEGRLLADGTIVPLKVKVGDKVVFPKIQGESYNDGINVYLILSELSIIAILGEDENENN